MVQGDQRLQPLGPALAKDFAVIVQGLIVECRGLSDAVAQRRLNPAPFDAKPKSVESQAAAGFEVRSVTAPKFRSPTHRLHVPSPLGSGPVGVGHASQVIASFGLIGRRRHPPQEVSSASAISWVLGGFRHRQAVVYGTRTTVAGDPR